MDRSFLTDASVVEASRNFVCLRLATYEDSDEGKFLEKIYGGTLSNTVFTVLTPDATKTLLRPGRGPSFRNGGQLANWMNELVEQDYVDAPRQRWSDPAIPAIKSLDLALNVASCDSIPVIVTVGRDPADVNALQAQLLPVAWNEEFGGQFIYADATMDKDLRSIVGLSDEQRGVYVVQPDAYGLSGKVLYRFDEHEDAGAKLHEVLASYQATPKNHGQHVQLGAKMGFRWYTETPVTDQQFVRATERVWGEKYKHLPPPKSTDK